jgi:hypothetical protein
MRLTISGAASASPPAALSGHNPKAPGFAGGYLLIEPWESLLAHPVSCPTDGVHLSQQMQWTPRGAHLLLQTRAHTLDGTLRPLFKRWYPGLTNDNDADAEQAAA